MIAAKRVKNPRVIWRELEARGVTGVTCARLAVGERIVGIAGENLDNRLVHADDAGVHETDLPHANWTSLALRDDGGAALLHTDDAIVEVELPSGRARPLGEGGFELTGYVFGLPGAAGHAPGVDGEFCG